MSKTSAVPPGLARCAHSAAHEGMRAFHVTGKETVAPTGSKMTVWFALKSPFCRPQTCCAFTDTQFSDTLPAGVLFFLTGFHDLLCCYYRARKAVCQAELCGNARGLRDRGSLPVAAIFFRRLRFFCWCSRGNQLWLQFPQQQVCAVDVIGKNSCSFTVQLFLQAVNRPKVI